MTFKLIDPKKAKEIQKESKLISSMSFGFRLFQHDSIRYPTLMDQSFNLFQQEKISSCMEKAKETFGITKFFNTSGKYLYKTFCLEFEGDYFFIYLHRTRGDGIDTTCRDSKQFYKFLRLLLKECGQEVDDNYWKDQVKHFVFNKDYTIQML